MLISPDPPNPPSPAPSLTWLPHRQVPHFARSCPDLYADAQRAISNAPPTAGPRKVARLACVRHCVWDDIPTY